MKADVSTILGLTNDAKRKEFLDRHGEWEIWVNSPDLHMTVRRLELPDDSAITATMYEGMGYVSEWGPDKGQHKNSPRFCVIKKGKHFKPTADSTSFMVEHLRGVRLELVGRQKEAQAG